MSTSVPSVTAVVQIPTVLPAAVVQIPSASKDLSVDGGAGASDQIENDKENGEDEVTTDSSKNQSSQAGAGEKNVKKKTKKKNVKSSSGSKSRNAVHVDIFSPSAMQNAVYICHNVQDILACRGYPWPLAQSKTGNKKK